LSKKAEFGDEISKIAQTESGIGVVILAPSGQFRFITCCSSQHSVPKNAFSVRTVFENLANGPSVRCMNFVNLFSAQMACQFTNPIELIV
jgi:hypothetical protein